MRKQKEELTFTDNDLRELGENQAWKAFLSDIQDRADEFVSDLTIPAKTRTIEEVRVIQGSISEDKFVLLWRAIAENDLKQRTKENSNAK